MDEQKIAEQLASMDNKLDMVAQKIVEHDGTLNVIAQKIAEHDEKFIGLDTKMDILTNKIIEHDEILSEIKETMATKSDFNEILNKLDTVLVEVKTTRQESIILNHRLDKVEAKVGI